jgi:hypothetical protein
VTSEAEVPGRTDHALYLQTQGSRIVPKGGLPRSESERFLFRRTQDREPQTPFYPQILRRRPKIYWPAREPEEEINTNPSGASGGPVYFVDEDRPPYGYLELAGFIYEFHASLETVRARHADWIRADGTLVR